MIYLHIKKYISQELQFIKIAILASFSTGKLIPFPPNHERLSHATTRCHTTSPPLISSGS